MTHDYRWMLIIACFASFNAAAQVKNIILMIGDGMGPQQLALAIQYRKQILPDAPPLAFEQIMKSGETGLALTYPHQGIVVDSACSGSQLASGQFSRSEMIGLDIHGNPVETILEKAKKLNKSTGLISDTVINHATPAAFAAHVANRKMMNEIASQMMHTGVVDIMLSGGLSYFLPQTINDPDSTAAIQYRKQIPQHIKLKSQRKDDQDLLKTAQQKGYQVVFDHHQLNTSQATKILGLFDNYALPDGIEYHLSKNKPDWPYPSLKEMSIKAIDRLSQNPNGFFLMIEAGQIDWAGHQNDAGALLHELLKFNQAIQAVYNWAKQRDDTLLMVTADHETGAFGFSYSNYQVPEARALSGLAFKEQLFKPKFNFAPPRLFTKLANQKISVYRFAKQFNKLPDTQKTPATLVKMTTELLEYTLSAEQAHHILELDQQYRYHQKNNELNQYQHYYPYLNNHLGALIMKAISHQQFAVWGTGTHTHTPVPVITYGPKFYLPLFDGMKHTTEIGQLLIQLLTE